MSGFTLFVLVCLLGYEPEDFEAEYRSMKLSDGVILEYQLLKNSDNKPQKILLMLGGSGAQSLESSFPFIDSALKDLSPSEALLIVRPSKRGLDFRTGQVTDEQVWSKAVLRTLAEDALEFSIYLNNRYPEAELACFGHSEGAWRCLFIAAHSNLIDALFLSGALIGDQRKLIEYHQSFGGGALEKQPLRDLSLNSLREFDRAATWPIGYLEHFAEQVSGESLARELTMQVFFYHGEHDKSAPVDELKKFQSQVRRKNNFHFYFYKDQAHRPNQSGRTQIVRDISEWLKK